MKFFDFFQYFILVASLIIFFIGLLAPAENMPAWTKKNDKILHAAAFFIFFFLMKFVFKNFNIYTLLLIFLIMSWITEFIQDNFSFQRHFSLGDVIANSLGSVVAFMCFWVYEHSRFPVTIEKLFLF